MCVWIVYACEYLLQTRMYIERLKGMCVCVWSTEKTYIRNLRCGLTERSDAWRVRVFGQKSTAIYPLSTIETPLMRVRVYCVYVSIYFLPVLFPTANRLESRAPSNAKETKAAKRQNWLWVIYFHFLSSNGEAGHLPHIRMRSMFGSTLFLYPIHTAYISILAYYI